MKMQKRPGEGLDWDYAMLWSNNSTDILATFIPGAAGGSSGQEVDQDYESCEVLWKWSKGCSSSALLGWGRIYKWTGILWCNRRIF